MSVSQPSARTRRRHLCVAALASIASLRAPPALAHGDPSGVRDKLGPLFRAAPNGAGRHAQRPDADARTDAVRRWNRIAIDASGLDHTPVAAGETRVFGEQLGPGRSARAMAIVHIAIFDAVNAIHGGHLGYAHTTPARDGASLEAAVAQAAHDTLAALYPSQAAALGQLLAQDLARMQHARGRRDAQANGVELGRAAAAAILALRAGDGSAHAEPRMGTDYVPSGAPGQWRQDPVSRIPLAMGAKWGSVKPFVMQSGAQFRLPPPPALTSAEYTAAFDEVKRLGGDGTASATVRTENQARIGIYWAYDGTPSLCAPPRLYNQIATRIAALRHTSPVELARLLALVNVAMADSGIAIWDSKFHHAFWRPVTAIREADASALGPGDGNPATIADPAFMPLGAPASNLAGPNFTPPFPAYPSGHAGFGGALFQTLRNFYGTDRIRFDFVSDEFNGITADNTGQVRALLPRRFESLSQAEEENGQSRIYLGIHWSFDKTQGIAQGRQVADHVFRNAFTPSR